MLDDMLIKCSVFLVTEAWKSFDIRIQKKITVFFSVTMTTNLINVRVFRVFINVRVSEPLVYITVWVQYDFIVFES